MRGLRRSLPAALATVAMLAALATVDATSAGAEAPLRERVAAPLRDRPLANSVTAFGSARDHGPSVSLRPRLGLVAMTPTPDGRGYWLAAGSGDVFPFGVAPYYGSAEGVPLEAPLVDIVATPDGGGYWLVAADGGVFTFGNATFLGSAGGMRLNAPIVGAAGSSTDDGYWLAAADGGVFSFGDAPFVGSAAEMVSGDAVVDIAAAASGLGYWLASERGQVMAFGLSQHGAPVEGGAADGAATVAIAADPSGDGYWLTHGAVPVLRPSDAGPAVRRLQERLDGLGYWVGPLDGRFGDLTRQAVLAFQKYEGLGRSGVLDGPSREALEGATRPSARTTDGTVIEVDKARQLVFFVRDGRVAWVFNTSTGTEEPYTYEGATYLADTPPGRWTVYRQVDGIRESNLGRLIRPKYFHPDGIAIHGYPLVPARPVSHGCVRVSLPAIDFIWAADLAPLGSAVWVY